MHYSQHNLSDTIVAQATPPGTGAIAVIRLSGKEAISIADVAFIGKNLKEQNSHTIHFGTIRQADGTIIDEVLVSLFKGPNSYTGEDVVEVSCHGSDYIIQQLIHLFIQSSARLAQPGEFTMRAFLNGKMDLSQAEAVADLIASTSASSHAIALKQMRGGFSEEIKNLREELINFASLIELELDFSEEDVEFVSRTDLQALVEKIQTLLRKLIRSFELGNVLKNGVNTVLAGRPNAGKSTLLNVLLNEERAIVSHIAGTTRDTIEETLNIKGIQFRLIDTAGIRDAQDHIEAIGVQKTFEKIQQSAILVYIFDIEMFSPFEVKQDVDQLEKQGVPMLIIANKTDKTQKDHLDYQAISTQPIRFISAKNPNAAKEVEQALYDIVLSKNINLESTIITNARHYDALQKASDNLSDVLKGIASGIPSDLVALDIRQALHHLGEITGDISTDDLLGNVFGKFCIGK